MSVAPAVPPLFLGGDVPAPLLTRLARRWGLAVARREAAARADIVLTLRADIGEMTRVLAAGARAYIEFGHDGCLSAEMVSSLQAPAALHMVVGTVNGFGLEAAPILCNTLLERGWLAPRHRGDAELCLHEALNNAIIHGNLGISQGPGGMPDGFNSFLGQIRQRLADPNLASRHVFFEARRQPEATELIITDEGEGFVEVHRPTDQGLEEKSGRGLTIMRELADAVTITQGGRRIALLFRS